MWLYRTTGVLITLLQIPLALITWFTTLVSGVIAALPLVGLVYILAISLIWQVILWPLIAGAWAWLRLPAWLSWPIGIAAIPLILAGDTFLKLTGALSPDAEDRIGYYVKLAICQQWPYPFKTDDGEHLLTRLQRENEYGFVRAVIELNDALVRRQLGLG